MKTTPDVRAQHRRALAAASEAVAQVRAGDLSLPTPCGDWDLAGLLAHMIGQNLGFALAVSAGDAPESSYAAPKVWPDELSTAWDRSADRVLAAFHDVELEREVRLVQVNANGTFPAAVAIGMHLLDTVIHTWDVATSLGNPYRPDDDLVEIIATQASRVPAGSARTKPGSAFAPVITTTQTDPWLTALATLGRATPN